MITGAIRQAEVRVREMRRFLSLSEKKTHAIKNIIERTEVNFENPIADWAQEASSFTAARTYDYACSVVLLYGLIERFIEDLAEEYLDILLNRLGKFNRLPEKLRQTHFDVTIAQLLRTRDSRYNGKCDAASLASSLASCLAEKESFDFIKEPFLHHTSNFRVPVVDDFLNRIGIPQASRRAVDTQAFKNYSDSLIEGFLIKPDRPESVWDGINDLVELRNQVAHGDLSSVLAPSSLFPYCDLIESYCKGLQLVVRDTLAGTLALEVGVNHGKPLAVHNHAIVCIQSKGVEIRPGAVLACYNGTAWYSISVEEIEVERQKVLCTPKGSDVAVGLRTDGRCKKEHDVFTIF